MDHSDPAEKFELSLMILDDYPDLMALEDVPTKHLVSSIYNLNRMAAGGLQLVEENNARQGIVSAVWLYRVINQVAGLLGQLMTAPDKPIFSYFLAKETDLLDTLELRWRVVWQYPDL